MGLLEIPPEIISLIISYLNNRDKCNFLAICKQIRSTYSIITITTPVELFNLIGHEYIDSFTCIILSFKLDSRFTLYRIPARLTHVLVKDSFHLDSNYYPLHTVTHMMLGRSAYNFRNNLPPGLIHLEMERTFNASLTGILPKTITHLQLSNDFSQHIYPGDLPNGLIHLTLGREYNVPTPSASKVIPSTIKVLHFGYKFNRLIDLSSLINLTHLRFGEDFDQSINLSSLINLTHLTFSRKFNQSITQCIPSNVTHLAFSYSFNKPIDTLPSKLVRLKLGNDFNYPIDAIHNTSITNLKFWGKTELQANCIPESVTNLNFGDQFNQSLIGLIPCGIKYLTLGNAFNQLIANCIPNTCMYLKLGNNFNQPIVGHISHGLTHLIIGERFCQPINGLPDCITHLTLDHRMMSNTDLMKFPTSVTNLGLPYYKGDIIACIPPTVYHLHLKTLAVLYRDWNYSWCNGRRPYNQVRSTDSTYPSSLKFVTISATQYINIHNRLRPI
jgi:hypothetical protein